MKETPVFRTRYANVTGTEQGSELVYNNTAINSTEGPSGIVLRGSQTVSSPSHRDLSHFHRAIARAEPAHGLGIDHRRLLHHRGRGHYVWLCETACGAGTNGFAGAMSTPGWMNGSIVVS